MNGSSPSTFEIEARFWSKVDRSGDGCWEWAGFREPVAGYGRFSIGHQRNMQAHRAVPNGALARQFGVSASTVSAVALRKRWGHVA